MRAIHWSSITCLLASFACTPTVGGSDESESTTETTATTSTETTESETTESETTESETTESETDTDGEPPLTNGPGGDSVMELGCAPNDGLAWDFTIALGGGCDMGQPDPSAPFVVISVYDGELLGDPVGMTVEWTDWQGASGYYAPDGQNGMTVPSIAGSLHIDSWDNPGEIGSTITGWYTMSFEVGEDIGAAFVATSCGGSPMCG